MSSSPSSVAVVIPAYNEARRVGETIAAAAGIAGVDEIVVVDDGSNDETARVAEAAGASVVRLPRNVGKGGALAVGVDATRSCILLLLDADLGTSAREAVALVAPVASGSAEMAIATFPVVPGRGGGFGLVVKLARIGIRWLTGRRMEAPLSGQRALRRELWQKCGLSSGAARGFGLEVALTVAALRGGYRVVEVRTEMTHRVTGRDWPGMRHRAWQFLAVVRALALSVRRPAC